MGKALVYMLSKAQRKRAIFYGVTIYWVACSWAEKGIVIFKCGLDCLSHPGRRQ